MILRVFSPKFAVSLPPTIRQKRVSVTIVCTPHILLGWVGGVGGVEPPTKFSKRGKGLDRILIIFRGGFLVKRVVTFFRGDL